MGTKTSSKFRLSSVQKQKLKKALDENQSSFKQWNPVKKGDTITGKVLKIKSIESKKGRKTIKSDLAILLTETGETSLFLKTVLHNKWNEQNVKVNDVVMIRYEGKVKDYHNYSLSKL